MTSTCSFGLCTRRDAAPVVSPTAIGSRVDVLCPEHAARQQVLNAALLAAWARLGARERTAA